MITRNNSVKKEQIIADLKNSKLEKGYKVSVLRENLYETNYRPKDEIKCTIIEDLGYEVVLEYNEYSNSSKTVKVNKKCLIYYTWKIGANPYHERNDKLRNINFALESILFDLSPRDRKEKYKIVDGVKVEETNWNPFVIINGEKKYYQRPFVWTLQDKQNLIDSIYHGIGCGKIIIRKRAWETVENLVKQGITDIAFNDIIDGKQRLSALFEFVDNKFPDRYGNYFDDLSDYAKDIFGSNQLFSYAVLGDDATDEDVLEQFLKVNFTGVQQSAEHIEYVKSLYKEIK